MGGLDCRIFLKKGWDPTGYRLRRKNHTMTGGGRAFKGLGSLGRLDALRDGYSDIDDDEADDGGELSRRDGLQLGSVTVSNSSIDSGWVGVGGASVGVMNGDGFGDRGCGRSWREGEVLERGGISLVEVSEVMGTFIELQNSKVASRCMEYMEAMKPLDCNPIAMLPPGSDELGGPSEDQVVESFGKFKELAVDKTKFCLEIVSVSQLYDMFAVLLSIGRNGDQSVPEESGAKGNNSSSDSNKSNDTASQKSHHRTLDWREFRAALFAGEQLEVDSTSIECLMQLLALLAPKCYVPVSLLAETAGTGSLNQDAAQLEPKPLGLKWAHPISAPEDGCILVASEQLDGVRTFERTVVLLLRSGTSHPQEGPFGVVINRPLNKRIKHMKPTNLDLATTFADCSLHFGGPLEASMFLMKTGGKSQLPGFEGVIPGLCYGARNSLDEAAALVKKRVLKPQDFKFYVGYAGWQLNQLREEIESDYWYVAACSANLIFGGSTNSSSSEGLWEEILQLMGGHYSELGRKPKQDT
ncbi:electron transporter, putative [Actinidia rufa]|uniref:Electron transporter, putative n=1 Tax=Actinidia rufa TaxID=165716 RepID=A0A7J0FDS1_9ERIC|nr:electron transporter, putative [Actinidia rufa]